MKRLFVLLPLLLVLLTVGIAPISAQAAAISLSATWLPGTQLDTIDTNGSPYPTYDNGDDYRYVEVRFTVTTNIEFWATELVCTVNGALLNSYIPNASIDPNDDQPMMNWSGMYVDGSPIEIPPVFTGSTPALLKMTTAASRQAGSRPLGRNGVPTTFQLGVMRFQVKPAAVSGTSPLTCTSAFLDRNGRPVVAAPMFVAPPALSIITGYTISGKVTYPGRASSAGIGVSCIVNGNFGSPFNGTTNAAGVFTVLNVRPSGWAECSARGNITDASPANANADNSDLFLRTQFNIDVGNRGSYTFLPNELPGGNLDQVQMDGFCGSNQCIDSYDVARVTQSWLTNANGDVNGDAKTDKADLAIVAANYGWQETVFRDHVLYSVSRLWTTGRESRVYVGFPDAGAVTQIVPTAPNTIDLWATVSPDGATIAFIRKTIGATPAATKYELFKMPTAGGAAAPILMKAAANNLDAFAPAWSDDGTRIGFACSAGYGDTSNTPAAAYTGYGTNAGALCVVDATGKNFRVLTAMNQVRIAPPAWDGTWLIYGATPNSPTCPDSLCVYDLWSNYNFQLDPDIPGGSGIIADMPVRGNQYLFYRYINTNAGPEQFATLRMIDSFDYTCPAGVCDFVHAYQAHPSTCAGTAGNDVTTPRPAFVHTNVVFDADGNGAGCTFAPVDANMSSLTAPFQVDYYDVSTYGMNIMMYGFNMSGFVNATNRGEMEDNTNGLCADGDFSDSNRCWPEWYPVMDNDGYIHFVDSMVGNFFQIPDEHTLFWAEHDTVDWVP